MQVFVTGGTGLIGRRLVRRLAGRGDDVVLLTRDRATVEAAGLAGAPRVQVMKGDPTTSVPGIWREALGESHAVVNLAGEPIFGRRWNDEVKARILQSRVKTTQSVVAAIGLAPEARRPKTLVNASAVGYYGLDRGDEVLAEDASQGRDFLARVCGAWEDAARGATAHGTRVVVLRIAVVLAPGGGALAQIAPPFRMFVGGPIGHGRQWFPWIHVDDLVELILFALDNPAALRGPVNAAAPNPLRFKEFAKDLGRTLGRPSWLPVPVFALKLRFGEVAQVIAGSQHVIPVAAQAAGFQFRFPTAAEALADIFAKKPAAAAAAGG